MFFGRNGFLLNFLGRIVSTKVLSFDGHFFPLLRFLPRSYGGLVVVGVHISVIGFYLAGVHPYRASGTWYRATFFFYFRNDLRIYRRLFLG